MKQSGRRARASRPPLHVYLMPYWSSTSIYPRWLEVSPDHQMRFGLDGSSSILLASDSTIGSENSVQVSVLGSKRAILSAVCSVTQITLRLASGTGRYMPLPLVGGS